MLRIENISIKYQSEPLLAGVNLIVDEGEVLCLLGPSGSGKSTLLRIIAGLEIPETGKLYWDDINLKEIPPYERNFGFMFQDYALFPHMNVWKNIAFGLEMKKYPRKKIENRVQEALDLVEMSEFADRNVVDLSGGEKQRVALARALAPRPRLLMLDEPLGSLDRNLREQLIMELGMILKRLETPVIYVTHDQEEAFSIGNHLAVLHKGTIVQADIPEKVYSAPASLWLAGFLGFSNHVKGIIQSRDPLCVSTALGVFHACDNDGSVPVGKDVTLVFKPDGLSDRMCGSSNNCLEGIIRDCLFFGDRFKLILGLENGQQFTFFWNRRIEPGQKISFLINPNSILCYRGSDG